MFVKQLVERRRRWASVPSASERACERLCVGRTIETRRAKTHLWGLVSEASRAWSEGRPMAHM